MGDFNADGWRDLAAVNYTTSDASILPWRYRPSFNVVTGGRIVVP